MQDIGGLLGKVGLSVKIEEAEKTLTMIAKKARLAEGSEGIRSIILTMFRYPSLKNKKIAQKTGIAIPALAAARGELFKAGIIESRTSLGDQGRKWAENLLNLAFDNEPLPHKFNVDLIPEEFSYLEKIKNLLVNRPKPEFALDQSHADYDTVLKRTFFLLNKGDIEGRKIIFLGDDDTTSIAVGLTRLAKEITVLDTDGRILDFLTNSAFKLSLKNFNVIHHDLRNPCPERILNHYDLVVMDPPYTLPGLRLFLKRAKQLLRTNIKIEGMTYPLIGKKCMLCFGNKPPKELLSIQSSIIDHGFIIREMIPNFNHYKGASIIGQFSHLYYLNLTDTSTYENDLSLISHPIYTGEMKKRNHSPFEQNGFHFVGEMRFNSQKPLLEKIKIQEIFINSIISAGLNIVDIYNYGYHPHGFSAIVVLKSSHAAIHSWPEHGYISIDIFICDDLSKGIKVIQELKKELQPEKSDFFYIERGNKLFKESKPVWI
jgi:hypothetical protein